MGSSSSFIVGCFKCYIEFDFKRLLKKKLADESLKFEQQVLKEVVGSQDQILQHTADLIQLNSLKAENYKVDKLNISSNSLKN